MRKINSYVRLYYPVHASLKPVQDPDDLVALDSLEDTNTSNIFNTRLGFTESICQSRFATDLETLSISLLSFYLFNYAW